MATSTPIQTVRNTVYTILSEGLSGTQIYKWGIPQGGVVIPCVVISHVSGSSSPIGLGRVTPNGYGDLTRIRLQIDCFHRSEELVDQLGDSVKNTIEKARSTLRNSGIVDAKMIVYVSVGSEEAARGYRKIIDYEFFVEYVQS